MGRINLEKESARLLLAERIFEYPKTPVPRKHGPKGYTNYESFREWLRDDFSYRCAFSLFRETWDSPNFDIDHLNPQKTHPELTCDYNNLIYLLHDLNLKKGGNPLPDPKSIIMADCLHVETRGDKIGEIHALNKTGEQIISILRLDSPTWTTKRKNRIRILRSLAKTDKILFREYIGYPKNLPNLKSKISPDNTRPKGIAQSAHALKEKNILPEWY
jgi:hypothetical protein